MSFSWISVSCYILLRVNKYILASKKHKNKLLLCVFHDFPLIPLSLSLFVSTVSSQSHFIRFLSLCYCSLLFLGSRRSSSFFTQTHQSFPFSLSLLCTRLSLPPSPVTDLPLPLCDTLHLLTFQLSCLPSLSVFLILFPRHSLGKGIWHRVEQLSEKNTSRLKQDRSSQEKQNEQWTC